MPIDFRALNKKMVKNRYPIPRIDELMDEIHVSNIDLRSGYHQIRLREEEIPKSASICHDGHFEFLALPFGLTKVKA